jgi:hypothetical protein
MSLIRVTLGTAGLSLLIVSAAIAQDSVIIYPTTSFGGAPDLDVEPLYDPEMICHTDGIAITKFGPSAVQELCRFTDTEVVGAPTSDSSYIYMNSNGIRNEENHRVIFQAKCQDECDGPTAECEQLSWLASDNKDGCDVCDGPTAECTQELLAPLSD